VNLPVIETILTLCCGSTKFTM